MSVPLRFAAGDSCVVSGERGLIHRIINGLAAVQFGEAIREVPVGDLDIALPKLGPTVRRGKSKQDYETPAEFIGAVVARFGPIVCDLAADASNAKAAKFYDKKTDSFGRSWSLENPSGNLWLNPPFGHIAPWAKCCVEESTLRLGMILMLVPASVGSDWFAEHVHRKAMVLALSPRIVFVGEENGYPRDLMLACYGHGLSGFDCWRWKP